MRPSDALYHKRILLDLCRRNNPDPAPDGVPTEVDLLTEILPDCETYFVSADMAAIARAAATTLPIGSIAFDVLPTWRGFALFDRPIGRSKFADGDVPVSGVAWCQSHSSECVVHGRGAEECSDDCKEDVDREVIEFMPLLLAESAYGLMPRGGISWYGGSEVAEYNGPELDSDEPFIRTVLATFILMQQTISEVDRQPAERHERKRWARAGLSAHDIVIIRVRRILRPRNDDQSQTPVDWSHRWLVSGHWRQQPYQSEGVTRPLWINPYVKGPSDKPIVVKNHVTAWVR